MRSTTARRRHAGTPDCLGQGYSLSVLRCSICNCARCVACCSRSTSTPLGGKAVRYSATRSEEHTSELQSLMRISYAVFCLKKKQQKNRQISVKNTMKKNKNTHDIKRQKSIQH